MLATKALFPYQRFQGDYVLDSGGANDESSDSEDSDDVATNFFCMATEDPETVEAQRRADAKKGITKGLAKLDKKAIESLPVYWRWVVEAFAVAAVENPLTFETATHHDLILDEFKELREDGQAGQKVKLGRFWKSGTYGEITCPAVDIIVVRDTIVDLPNTMRALRPSTWPKHTMLSPCVLRGSYSTPLYNMGTVLHTQCVCAPCLLAARRG